MLRMIGSEWRAAILVLIVQAALLVGASTSAQSTGVQIDQIDPLQGRAGDAVTVRGSGFGGGMLVRVDVGGRSASILRVRGNELVFAVPPGLPTGSAIVTITNPGGRAGTTALTIIGDVGGALPGPADRRALDAVSDMPPVGVPATDIADGIILTRLDVVLDSTATVGQVNAALAAINAGIVSMRSASPFLTVAIPRAAGLAELVARRATLAGFPGILAAMTAAEPASKLVQPGGDPDQVSHLLATRFPAAWNVKHLIVSADGACLDPSRRVTVLVPDNYSAALPTTHTAIANQLPNLRLVALPPAGYTNPHGWDVASVLGAQFDADVPLGANPFHACLDVAAIPVNGMSGRDVVDEIASRIPPTGPFIVNLSVGYHDTCASACGPADFTNNPRVPSAHDRAQHALHWKHATRGAWGRFLVFAAAGNERGTEAASLFPGLADGRFKSALQMAAIDDPFLGIAGDASLWTSAGLPSLAATSAELQALQRLASSLGIAAVGGAPNVAIVGATTHQADAAQLAMRASSNSQSTLNAVGELVYTLSGGSDGTSFSTPQVAGLASYLWLLADRIGVPLRDRPSTDTLDIIRTTSRDTVNVSGLIDAYGAVLALDRLTTGQPIRRALLDVNADATFDDLDLLEYEQALRLRDPSAHSFPAPDYGRYDLNGDGATGGRAIERFDLNADGVLGPVEVAVEDRTITMDETALTDLEILCYYAYSSLYRSTDDTIALREDILGLPRCAIVVDPPRVALVPGETQQFTATVGTGSAVVWSASACTITQTGLYTACSAPGTVTVRATSIEDPDLYAEATVTPRGEIRGQITHDYSYTTPTGSRSGSVSAFITGRFINGQLTVTSVSGTGSVVDDYTTWPCRPYLSMSAGTVTSVTVQSGPGAYGGDLRLLLQMQGPLTGGTPVNGECQWITVLGLMALGGDTLYGTLVYEDSALAAIDFNHEVDVTVAATGTRLAARSTGRLEPVE